LPAPRAQNNRAGVKLNHSLSVRTPAWHDLQFQRLPCPQVFVIHGRGVAGEDDRTRQRFPSPGCPPHMKSQRPAGRVGSAAQEYLIYPRIATFDPGARRLMSKLQMLVVPQPCNRDSFQPHRLSLAITGALASQHRFDHHGQHLATRHYCWNRLI
jgi:hypothetical protein